MERKKQSGDFNPNREFLEKAEREYFKNGGTITTINPADRVDISEIPLDSTVHDQYLMGM